MTTTIDLSGPLFNGMWSYNALRSAKPALPEFQLDVVTTVAADGAEILHYNMSSLSGTYLETGAHLIEGAPTLSDLPCSAFILPAVICHVPRKGPRQLIRRAELEANCPPVRQGDALLIECGWSAQWHTPTFVTQGPNFHPDCLPWLMSQPLALLACDVPSMQSPWAAAGSPEDGRGMLLKLFSKGILLLAPIVNLDKVEAQRGELIALPLHARGASGSPCRAILRVA
jgi:arylformamidase